jgi:hypothetical protein
MFIIEWVLKGEIQTIELFGVFHNFPFRDKRCHRNPVTNIKVYWGLEVRKIGYCHYSASPCLIHFFKETLYATQLVETAFTLSPLFDLS